MKRTLMAVLVVGTVSGCANQGELVRRRAAFDLSCAAEQLQVTELTDRAFGVTGCGQKATYVVEGLCKPGYPCVPVLNSPKEGHPTRQ
jgi:hypothetical protein